MPQINFANAGIFLIIKGKGLTEDESLLYVAMSREPNCRQDHGSFI